MWLLLYLFAGAAGFDDLLKRFETFKYFLAAMERGSRTGEGLSSQSEQRPLLVPSFKSLLESLLCIRW